MKKLLSRLFWGFVGFVAFKLLRWEWVTIGDVTLINPSCEDDLDWDYPHYEDEKGLF